MVSDGDDLSTVELIRRLGKTMDRRVSLLPGKGGSFVLAVALDVTLPQVEDAEEAMRIVAAAHKVCPYSNATRGNIEVELTANGQAVQ